MDGGLGAKQMSAAISVVEYEEFDFHNTFHRTHGTKSRATFKEQMLSDVKAVWRLENLWSTVKSTFPVLVWLPSYDFRKDILSDVVSGLTTAVYQIPQGMAYGLLSAVPPVCGLYTSLFPLFVYMLMGTSRHLSIGTMSIVALMTGSVVNDLVPNVQANNASIKEASAVLDKSEVMMLEQLELVEMKPKFDAVEVAIVLTLLVGLIQIAFGICRLGALSVYFSPQLVSGFTTAAAIYAVVSQLANMFDVHVSTHEGPLNLIYTLIDFFGSLPHTNCVTLFITLSAISLLIVKDLVEQRFKRKSKIPVPADLLLMIVATAVSFFLKLNERYEVSVIGVIPKGFPDVTLPNFAVAKHIATKSFAIAIVGFSQSVSMAQIFAQKHRYLINANQELIALGSANVLGSFFSCLPAGGSLSRSSVQESTGGKTQLVSLIGCGVVLAVLLWLGSLMHDLPKCILSALIVVALKSLLLQVKDLKRYWKISKLDAMIWLVTFLSVILLDVDIGLAVGVAFSLFTVLWRSQRPRTFLMGAVGNTHVYAPVKKCPEAKEVPGVKIFYFGGPLHFCNTTYFLSELYRMTGISDRTEECKEDETEPQMKKVQSCASFATTVTELDNTEDWNEPGEVLSPDSGIQKVTHLVLDCSGFGYIDAAGAEALRKATEELKKKSLMVFFACCPANVYWVLERDNFLNVVPSTFFFPTVHDAIQNIRLQREEFHPTIDDEDDVYIQHPGLARRRSIHVLKTTLPANQQPNSAGGENGRENTAQ